MTKQMGFICLLLLHVHTVFACEPPFVVIGNGCYLYSGDLNVIVDSFDAAQSLCQNDGADLAIAKEEDTNQALVLYLLAANNGEDKVLLGARQNDFGFFEWLDGTLVRNGFESWGDNQPSGNGECMGYSDDHDLQWDDFQCDSYISSGLRVGFMCEQTISTTQASSSTTTIVVTTAPTTTTTTPVTTDTTRQTRTRPETTTPVANMTDTMTTTQPSTIMTTTSQETTEETTTATTQAATTTGESCPPPFVDLVVGCYYLLDQTDDFWTAQDNCLSEDAHLAYIDSLEKQLAIEEYLSSITFETNPWIGAHDLHGNDTFYWLDGIALDDGFTNYGELEGGIDDGLIANNDFEWNDAPLDSLRASLCEKF